MTHFLSHFSAVFISKVLLVNNIGIAEERNVYSLQVAVFSSIFRSATPVWSKTLCLSELFLNTPCSEHLRCPVTCLKSISANLVKVMWTDEITFTYVTWRDQPLYLADAHWLVIDSCMADKQCFTWRKEVDDTRGYKRHLLWTPFLCFRIVFIWISVCCASKPFVQSSFSESLKALQTHRLVVTELC